MRIFYERSDSMIKILFGVFFVLHGLVHLLYFGQSAKFFELQPGMVWPDGSWTFSSLLGNATARNLASIFLILAAIGFIASGAGVLLKQGWWLPAAASAAIFSSAIFIFFWDGVMQHLDNKGGVGILINLAILAVLRIFF
jgi:uncharacterized membrane protein YphA (DoxX/SURF4 family)